MGVAVAFPVLTWNWNLDEDEAPEPTGIQNYRATFVVAEDGSMQATEEILVSFPAAPSRRGIFRFFDTADLNTPQLRRDPKGVAVRMDGKPVEVRLEKESHGRYVVARIGRASRTVSPGVHTYRITYRVDDVLIPSEDGSSRFYWDLVPGGWRQRIERARLRVVLPAATSAVRCAVGSGADGGCTARSKGGATLLVRIDALPPRTPVTLSTDVALKVAEPAADRYWGPKWDPVLGPSRLGLAGVALLALLAGVLGLMATRLTLEVRPSYPLQYAPPEGIGPAQGRYILEEKTDRAGFVATIMHLAEGGSIDLDHEGPAWRMTPRTDEWSGLDEVTGETVRLLGLKNDAFLATPKDVGQGKRLKKAMDGSEEATKSWASAQGLMTSAGLGSLGGIVILVALGLFGAILFLNPLGMTALALVPGAFAATGLWVAVPGAGTRRTTSGRDLWSRLGGFRRVMSTPSSKQRFEFSGRQELYTAYLPWAVAFGVADQWTAKYRTEMGAEPPTPRYFAAGYAGSSTGNYVDSMVRDFDQTVSSAVSSYEATQRSSGSSGGGFSGGGGGGGGGGGSW